MTKPQMIQIGEYGKRINESHGRAKLSDHEIELMRQLKEQGMPAREIAEKFEVGKRYVYKLVNFESRASIVVQYRRARRKGQGAAGAERSTPENETGCGSDSTSRAS